MQVFILIADSVLNISPIIIMADMIREIRVAKATPATPISKAATNSTSTAMFAVEEPARNRNGVRLSPSAVKMPVATL